jgi:hypothetical protein
MTLKITKYPTFTTTVNINTVHMKGNFEVTFVMLPLSEQKAEEEKAVKAGLGFEGLLYKVVKSHGPVDVYGETVADNGAESLARLLDVPGMGVAMLNRYNRSMWEEAQGN